MENIFLQIAEMINDKKTNQKDVSNNLNISQGNLSNLINGKAKASKPLLKLAKIIYGELRPPHPEPIIEKTILMMEDMDEHTKTSALDCVQKEKLLEELKKERQGRKAA